MWQIRKPKDEASPEEVAERTEQERRLMTVGDAGAFAPTDLHTDLKVELHQRLLGLINLSALEKMSRAQIEEEVGDIVLEELDKQRHALNHAERKQLVERRAQSAGRLRERLKDATAEQELSRELLHGIGDALKALGLEAELPRARFAARYLVTEIATERPQLTESSVAEELRRELGSYLEQTGAARANRPAVRPLL